MSELKRFKKEESLELDAFGSSGYDGTCLLSLCIELRMAANGSGLDIEDEVIERALRYLKGRLGKWMPSAILERQFFDEAVRLLVIATIHEVSSRMKSKLLLKLRTGGAR